MDYHNDRYDTRPRCVQEMVIKSEDTVKSSEGTAKRVTEGTQRTRAWVRACVRGNEGGSY